MQRRGVAWLLASAALLCCPSSASGSIDAARKTFNGAWPQGCAQVTIEQAEDVDPTVSGFATPGTCVVYLTPSFLSRSPEPELVCAVVVHEFGHLLGLGHSGDESNVMFPSPLPPPACQSTQEPDATAAQAGAAPVRAEIGDVIASAGTQQPTTGSELRTTRTARRTCFRSRASASSRRASAKRSATTRRARGSTSCKR